MRLTLNAGLELSKLLATQAGQQLAPALEFLSDLGDQVVSALRKQVTISDNLDAKLQTVELTTATEFVVNVTPDTGNNRTPVGIVPLQVISTTYGYAGFHWYIDSKGQAKIWMRFVDSTGTAPAASLRIKVVLLVSYG